MSFEGGREHHRQVNAVLGNLVRLHYPGVVTLASGERVPATSWKHYALSPDQAHGNAQGAVESDFWVSFSITLAIFVLFNCNP